MKDILTFLQNYMWSKLNKTLSKFINNTDKNQNTPNTSPTQLIEITIQELEEAITKTQESLHQTSENKQNIREKLQEYQTKSSHYYQEAVSATKSKQDTLAQEFIRKKNLADQQVSQYEVLYTNVSNTVYQFESQIEKMRMKIEELHSKEVVLKAKLENAKTQKELGSYLTELNQNADLEAFEHEINEIELEAKLVNDLQNLDEEEFEQLNNQSSMASLKDDIAAEERKIQEQRDSKRFKRINNIFDQNTSREKELGQDQQKNYNVKKQQLLQALMQQKAPAKEQNSTSDLKNFFENTNVDNIPSTDSSENASKSQQILDDFAKHPHTPPGGQTSEKTDSTDKKETLFDNFFGDDNPPQENKSTEKESDEEKKTKSANQKKIDDFFND